MNNVHLMQESDGIWFYNISLDGTTIQRVNYNGVDIVRIHKNLIDNPEQGKVFSIVGRTFMAIECIDDFATWWRCAPVFGHYAEAAR